MTHLTLDQIWLNTCRVGLIVNIFNLINIKLQQLICYSIKTKDINTFDKISIVHHLSTQCKLGRVSHTFDRKYKETVSTEKIFILVSVNIHKNIFLYTFQ